MRCCGVFSATEQSQRRRGGGGVAPLVPPAPRITAWHGMPGRGVVAFPAITHHALHQRCRVVDRRVQGAGPLALGGARTLWSGRDPWVSQMLLSDPDEVLANDRSEGPRR